MSQYLRAIWYLTRGSPLWYNSGVRGSRPAEKEPRTMTSTQEAKAFSKLYDQYLAQAQSGTKEEVVKLASFVKAVAAVPEYSFRNALCELLDAIREVYHSRFVEGPRNQVLRDERIAARQDEQLEANAQVAFETAADYEAARFIGTFTVEFANGEYETLRFRRQAPDSTFMPGRLVVGFLSGPDNTNDFQQFGHVDERGQLRIWRRYSNLSGGRKDQAARIVLGGADLAGQRQAYAMRSGRCSRCGRTLTVPASLYAGMGPECRNM